MILIKNGLVINPDTNTESEQDLLIENGKVKDLGKPGSFSDVKIEKTIDAKGKWIFPGLVDLHVHLREPGQEWKETILTGSQAAVLGGYTTVCTMPNTKPVNDNQEVTKFIIEKAKKAGLAKVLPIGSITKGLKGEEMSPFNELFQAGCVAFSDDGEPVFNSAIMYKSLEWATQLGVPLALHEEDKCLSANGVMNESGLSLRLGLRGFSGLAEEVMIARDIEIARVVGGRIHFCHVTTARGAELVRRAKNDGIKVTAEVCPHHLFLTEDAVSGYDANFKMSPPLRSEEDRLSLIAAIKDGTIDAIASDHAPHDLDLKRVEFGKAAFGVLGLQSSLPLILDLVRAKDITKLQAVKLLSSNPAQAFNLDAGKIKKGENADLIVIDPDKKWILDESIIASISKNTCFLGREMTGQAEYVFVDGKLVVEQGKLNDL